MTAHELRDTLSNSQKPADLVPSSCDIKDTYDSEGCRTDAILMMVHGKPGFNAITSDQRINLRSLQCRQAMDKQGLEACSTNCNMKRAASCSIRPCPVNFFCGLWYRTFEMDGLTCCCTWQWGWWGRQCESNQSYAARTKVPVAWQVCSAYFEGRPHPEA